MIKDLVEYFRQNEETFLPYVADKFGMSMSELQVELGEMWHIFHNPHMIDNLFHTNAPTQKWYFEVCNTPYKRGRSIPFENAQEHWRTNQRENQHMSVFAHDKQWRDNAIRTGSVSCYDTQLFVPWLWVELDRKDHKKVGDINKAIIDALKIKSKFSKDCIVYSSGNKSTHILINGSVIARPILSQKNNGIINRVIHRIVDNIRFGIGEADVSVYSPARLREHFQACYPEVTVFEQREVEGMNLSDYPNVFVWDTDTARSSTENLDSNIYNVNSLIRQPWSIHESGGHKKVPIDRRGHFTYGYKPFKFENNPPMFLDLYYEEWEDKKAKQFIDNGEPKGYIEEYYAKFYPEITEMQPNAQGWVGKFYSVLYDDTNAGVSINLSNGYHKDHGSEEFSMTMDEFKKRKKYT